MATSKYPPAGSGKSSTAKFGDFMNAKDVTGKNRGDDRAATVKKRANALMSARGLTGARPASPAGRKAASSEGPKKAKPVAPKRAARGGGSMAADLAKFGTAVRRNKSATSSKAKQISKRLDAPAKTKTRVDPLRARFR